MSRVEYRVAIRVVKLFLVHVEATSPEEAIEEALDVKYTGLQPDFEYVDEIAPATDVELVQGGQLKKLFQPLVQPKEQLN